MAGRKKKSVVQTQLDINPVFEKKLDTEAIARSVVDVPSVHESRSPGVTSPLLFLMTAADSIFPWGVDVAARDKQLREFYPRESVLLSAVYSVSVRNSSFEWEIVPADPRKDVRNTKLAAIRMLNNIGMGKGWSRTMIKTCVSLYTQDNGAFWEIVRREDRPDSPVMSINPLDSARCTRTGNPETPVIYQDRKGRYHELKWYHVITIEEMPSDIEDMYDVQFCAVTRALRMAQILKSIFVYKDEKVSGRNSRAIDFVAGVTQTQIQDAIRIVQETNDNLGYSRFSAPLIISGIDPQHTVSHERIDLASLPDNFDFDSEMKWYISILAMAFGVDYQEFAPLSTGAIGSGQQSEILHLKTHGKGPAAIMTLFEHIFNNSGILPSTIRFRFKDHDASTEKMKADSAYTRGRDRALRIQSGELDGIAARHMAIATGDLEEWIAEDLEERGIEATPATDLVKPKPNNTQNNPDGMQNTPDQISGAQQGAMRKQFLSGGMRALKDVKPVPISEDDVNKQRAALRVALGEMDAQPE